MKLRPAWSLITACGLIACGCNNDAVAERPTPAAKPSEAAQKTAAAEPAAPEKKVDETELLRRWPQIDPGAHAALPVSRAVAVLTPTEGNQTMGTVWFEDFGDEGIRVETKVENLPPGKHAYHVHVLGDCTAQDAKSAGTHFNFAGPSQDPPKDIQRLTGNLGELSADASGRATHETPLERAALTGAYSLVGRSVIVHAQPNNMGEPPMGAAGKRLACGVIGIAE